MNPTARFTNKHVLITGGARGIGFDIAKHFAREGANLSIMDFNKDQLEKATHELSQITKEVYPYNIDVSNHGAVNNAVTKAEHIQPIDVLINNAGIAFETPFLK